MIMQPAPIIIHDTSSGQPQVIQTDYQKVYLQSSLGQGKLDADATPAERAAFIKMLRCVMRNGWNQLHENISREQAGAIAAGVVSLFFSSFFMTLTYETYSGRKYNRWLSRSEKCAIVVTATLAAFLALVPYAIYKGWPKRKMALKENFIAFFELLKSQVEVVQENNDTQDGRKLLKEIDAILADCQPKIEAA